MCVGGREPVEGAGRFFVDYTVALAGKDKAGQQEAVDNLTGYTGAFSGFLAKATGLPQEALQEGLATHVMQLKGALDASAAGDFEESYSLVREAYAHMLATGEALAGAIVAHDPDMVALDRTDPRRAANHLSPAPT